MVKKSSVSKKKRLSKKKNNSDYINIKEIFIKYQNKELKNEK